MKSFRLEFEELPLVIENGMEAGLVNGYAEIEYFGDGTWGIDAIALDGFGLTGRDSKPVHLDATSPIQAAIYHRLEHEWRGKVDIAVQDHLHDDRDSRLDTIADQRRSERMRAM